MTSATMERRITIWVNGLSLAIFLLAGGIAWGTLSSQAQQNADDIEEIKTENGKDSQKIEDIRNDSTETRVRLKQVERDIDANSRKLDIILREIRQRDRRDPEPNQR